MHEKHDKLVILGAGGHAKVCFEIAKNMNLWKEILLLDDNPNNNYFSISGRLLDFEKYIEEADFFCAIGTNNFRKKILKKIEAREGNIISLIDPSAVISTNVVIDSGSVIMPGAVVNDSTIIKKGCILNTSCSIDHDNYIDDFVHISPGVHTGGAVKIGEKTWIGIGTTIVNNIRIEQDVIVGAGSLVVKDINKSGVYIGSPAKFMREN